MPFINRLKHGVDIAKFKADQLMRIKRVQGEIDELRQNINNIHRQLAISAIELHQRGELTNKELIDLCLSINELNRTIAEKEKTIAAIRAEIPPLYVEEFTRTLTTPCSECGWDVPHEADFCPNCGAKNTRPPAVSEVSCPSCGHPIPQSAAFCPDCGSSLSKQNNPTTSEEIS